MFEILRTRETGKLLFFDFVDETTGLEYKGWRLGRNRHGEYFVASKGERDDRSGKTHDDVRVANYAQNETGKAWMAALKEAALAAREANATAVDTARAALSDHPWAVTALRERATAGALRATTDFREWLGDREPTHELIAEWQAIT